MIRIDAAWLATALLDMRAGTDTALARMICVFGTARPHHAYVFANKRANRMKALVHEGIGIWLAARRLHQGKFIWPASRWMRIGNCNAPNAAPWCWACPGSTLETAESSPWSERPGSRQPVANREMRQWARLPRTGTVAVVLVEQQSWDNLSAEQLCEMTSPLLVEVRHKQAPIDKLTRENALLKRMKFAAQSERFNAEQRSLLEGEINADLAAVSLEIEQLSFPTNEPQAKQQPKRQPLPASLPRHEIRHEPELTICQCGCHQMQRIDEDVAEKLDHAPGVFTVERHICGKWACAQCETATQAPACAHVIDKCIPTAGLLAQVLVGKHADRLPLYRQESIFGRAGLAIPRSTLAQWVGT